MANHNDKFLQYQTLFTTNTKLTSNNKHRIRRHNLSIMNVASEKKEDKKCKTKGREKIDMEDTKNYLLKHSHNNTCQDAESLLQKQNPYGLKFKNISSTRKPNIS